MVRSVTSYLIIESRVSVPTGAIVACLLVLNLISLRGMSEENTLRLAVASNFLQTAKRLIDPYKKINGDKIEIISGSTGKLFAQINYGAPYHIFLAADSLRPTLLAKSNKRFDDTPYVYAIGRLVLWAPAVSRNHKNCNSRLLDLPFRRLALANPKTAPYGHAGISTLQKLGQLDSVKDRLVFGENVGHVLSYLVTGAVEIGFLSLSQVLDQNAEGNTCVWIVPREHYDELTQSALLLETAHDPSNRFMEFLRSEDANIIIQSSGYLTK